MPQICPTCLAASLPRSNCVVYNMIVANAQGGWERYIFFEFYVKMHFFQMFLDIRNLQFGEAYITTAMYAAFG